MLSANGAEVGAHDGEVDFVDGFDGLEFDHDQVLDEEIETVDADFYSPIHDCRRVLPRERDASQAKFNSQRFFVDRLQEARTKRLVNSNRSSDDLPVSSSCSSGNYRFSCPSCVP